MMVLGILLLLMMFSDFVGSDSSGTLGNLSHVVV